MRRQPRGSFSIRNRRDGTSSAEFGLAFIAFLLLITGIVELGRAAWTFNTIAHATKQGARLAQTRGQSSGLSQSTISTQVQSSVRNNAIGLVRNDVTVTTTWPNGNLRGRFVVVQASYPFRTVAGRLVMRQGSITVRASSRVPILN